MKRGFSILALVAGLFGALSPIPASAYYHFIYYLKSGNTPARFDLTALPVKTVRFYVSEAGPATYAANDSFAAVISQVRQAALVWNSVSSSDLRVAFGGLEDVTTQQNTPAADVVFEDLPPGLLAFSGPSFNLTPVTPAVGTPFLPITRSAVHLNLNFTVAPGPSYNESFFTTLVHEMGHALGLQHTFTSSSMSTATTRATSLMNPLDVDDIAGISVLYPNASFAANGTITGHITSGGSGVHLASVVAIRSGAGAVSAFTNPDGSYRIDGVPPGQYYVYAHPLPPDADVKGPWYPDGTVAAASGPTNALFYPGTVDLEQAKVISVRPGKSTGNIDIALTNRDSVPVYDVSVYGYFNNYTVAVKPAYTNMLLPVTPTVVAAGVGLGVNGQAPGLNAKFAGGSALVSGGNVRPYQAGGYTYVALDIGYMLGADPGPQHLIFTTPDFMHVLPSAVRLTQQNPPSVRSVSANPDGTLSVSASNLVAGSAIYFDGLPAAVSSLNMKTGVAIVTPPPGAGDQSVVVTVYNPDGQNSQFVQASSPVTYTYGKTPVPTIVSISPSSLPAGSEAMVDITSSGLNFVDGQSAVGFGTSDVFVRRIFVLDPHHLQVDVSVAANAALSNPDVSVFSGFETATAIAGFRIAPAVSGTPAVVPEMTNVTPGLNGSYAGATVSLSGTNLLAPNAAVTVTFNGEAAVLLFSSPTRIVLQIPADLAPGPTVLTLNNGAADSYPVTVDIATPPASVRGIQNASGTTIGASLAAAEGDLLTVSLAGFAPDGLNIALSRVQVGVGGVMHSVLTVTQSSAGIYQVSFLLNGNEAPGEAQTLIVYLDGRSSLPVTIPITTPDGSFIAPSAVDAGN